MTAAFVFAGGAGRTPAEIDERAARFAGGLAALGVQEGDVVAVLARNDPLWVDVIRGCRLAGVFYCPVNWHFKADEARHVLHDSGAKLLVALRDLAAPLADALPAGMPLLLDGPGADLPGAVDLSRWLAAQRPYDGPTRQPRGHMAYTSGTTGKPKGVKRLPVPPERLAAQMLAARRMVELTFGIRPGARALVSAPLYHSAPSAFASYALDLAELLVLAPRFDAEQTLELIERHRIDVVLLVPIMYTRLLKLPGDVRVRHDLSSLRYVASTGAPCAPAVKQAMLDWWGPVIHETYASSETGMLTVQTPDDARRKPGSAGRAIDGVELRIVATDGRTCRPGEQGVIHARSAAVPDYTYQNQPQARAAVERDGFVTVGDVGWLDDDGYLYVCDRASDMVLSGGVNIYPVEIEHVLVALPGVADCAVFGIPDDEYGEALAAVIEPVAGAALDAAAVQAFVRERLAGYKVPRHVEFVAALPRDDNGKVAKRRLRDAWWAGRERRI